jgi:hypothetical protein
VAGLVGVAVPDGWVMVGAEMRQLTDRALASLSEARRATLLDALEVVRRNLSSG